MLLKPAFPVLNREHPFAMNLQVAYLFESPGDVVRDHSGNARHSTTDDPRTSEEIIPAWTTGATGTSVAMSSEPPHGVILPSEVAAIGDYTLSSRIRVHDFSNAFHLSVQEADNSVKTRIRFFSSGRLGVQPARNFSTTYTVPAHMAIQEGEWVCVTVIRSRGQTIIAVRDDIYAPSSNSSGQTAYFQRIGHSWHPTNGYAFSHGSLDYWYLWDRALSREDVARLHHDPYAAFREPRSKFAWLFVSPPENLTAPTLQINPDGTWTGGLGTWSGNPTNYAWELRRAADDSVVDSGSTSDAGAVLVGSLFISGDYYLWVYAENSGGSLSAVSSTAVMQVGSQITFDVFRTSRRIMGEVRMGRRILGEVRIG